MLHIEFEEIIIPQLLRYEKLCLKCMLLSLVQSVISGIA